MKSLPNIEKSAFRKGYVGYADGVWHIYKSSSYCGQWVARHSENSRAPLLYAWRLSDLSAKLQAHADERCGLAGTVNKR
jgi:hypothetical protein